MSLSRTWNVEHLSCAACASGLEATLANLDGVKHASVNFIAKTITVESDGPVDDTFWQKIISTAKAAEPALTLHQQQQGITKMVYRFGGIDCPSCALTIEEALANIESVTLAHVDYAAKRITIETGESQSPTFFQEAIAVAQQIEPSLTIEPWKAQKERSAFLHARLYRLIISLLLLLSSFLFEQPALVLLSYAVAGYDVLFNALRNILRGKFFDEYFLMSIATVGALLIGERTEAAAVMLFYLIGEYFQESAVIQSRRSLLSALDLQVEKSRLINGDTVTVVDSERVEVGSHIRVLAGEKIPLDGTIVEGSSELDMRSLTGESLPQYKSVGDTVLSSSLNLSGTLEIRTTAAFADSTATKILHLVQESAAKKAQSERFISTFARYYTPVVVFLALALALIPSLITGAWSTWVYRALVFLVVSCPCAIVLSVPLSYFAGIGKSAQKGVVVKGGNYLEALSKVDTVVFDKTGTLTSGTFTIADFQISANATYDEATLIGLSASVERLSTHPLARAFDDLEAPYTVTESAELAGRGMQAIVDSKAVYLGNAALFAEAAISLDEHIGQRATMHLGVDGIHQGSFTLVDEPKAEAKESLERLQRLGVKHLVMISGDSAYNAERVATELGIEKVYASLLPDEKQTEVLALAEHSSSLVYVGDGINDAPSLAAAKVGISMGKEASDLAIESADVAILSEDLRRIPDLVAIAQKTSRIVKQNIGFALTVKALALLFGALGIATMWVAVIADTGVTFIAVLNALRILIKRPAR